MAMIVRTTSHTINEQTIEFSVLAPTVPHPATRRLIVTDENGGAVELYFEHDDFQLFKSIINEY